MELIAQSFIKEVFDFKAGKSCGLQLKARYYDEIHFPPSDVQLLGQWFEYKATGQTTREGTCPIPIRNKPKALTIKQKAEGQKPNIGALSKKFEDVLTHIEPMNKMFEAYGLEIVETGKRIIHNGLRGDIDVVCKYKDSGEIVFVDIKTSGLLDDKWSEYGWNTDALEYKDRLMIQVVQYKLLGVAEYGYEPDFLFFLFSNTNTVDRKAIKIVVDETRFNEHVKTVEDVRKLSAYYEQNGWTPHPEPKRCGKCPLAKECDHFTDIPKIITVNY